VQTSTGFLVTLVTLQILPILVELVSFRWAFLVLAVGPALAWMSMTALRNERRANHTAT